MQIENRDTYTLHYSEEFNCIYFRIRRTKSKDYRLWYLLDTELHLFKKLIRVRLSVVIYTGPYRQKTRLLSIELNKLIQDTTVLLAFALGNRWVSIHTLFMYCFRFASLAMCTFLFYPVSALMLPVIKKLKLEGKSNCWCNTVKV